MKAATEQRMVGKIKMQKQLEAEEQMHHCKGQLGEDPAQNWHGGHLDVIMEDDIEQNLSARCTLAATTLPSNSNVTPARSPRGGPGSVSQLEAQRAWNRVASDSPHLSLAATEPSRTRKPPIIAPRSRASPKRVAPKVVTPTASSHSRPKS